MSEFIDTIEDLGVRFRGDPTPVYPDAMLAGRLHVALIYTDVMPFPDRVHIPGTPLFNRREVALKSVQQEGGIKGAVALPSEETKEKTVYTPVFTAVSLRDDPTEPWGQLHYFDNITGAPLENPTDRGVAAVLLEAAVKKPVKNFNRLGLIGLGLLAEELKKAGIASSV